MITRFPVFVLSFSWLSFLQASLVEVDFISQHPANSGRSSIVAIRIQNGSPGSPDYGWGVGTVAEAIVDMEALFGKIVDTVVERNPNYPDRQSVWDSLGFHVYDEPTGEIAKGWFLEHNQYTSNLYGADNFGAPNIFDRYLVFRHFGGPRPPGIDYDTWDNHNSAPDKDSITFNIQFANLLDFDQDGRVDPNEILIWDGRTGGSYPSDYKPSVASPVTVPKGSGFYLHAGIDRQGGPIPILSIKNRHTIGENVKVEAGTATSLDFTAERADPYNYYRWIYIVQHSLDLQTWTNEAHYTGDNQAVSHPISAADSGFWRIHIANEKDYKAFNLKPADQTISAPSQTFTWKGAEAAESYSVYLSADATIESSELIATTTEASLDVSSLNGDTTYYWRVIATFADGLEVASSIASFTTRAE